MAHRELSIHYGVIDFQVIFCELWDPGMLACWQWLSAPPGMLACGDAGLDYHYRQPPKSRIPRPAPSAPWCRTGGIRERTLPSNFRSRPAPSCPGRGHCIISLPRFLRPNCPGQTARGQASEEIVFVNSLTNNSKCRTGRQGNANVWPKRQKS